MNLEKAKAEIEDLKNNSHMLLVYNSIETHNRFFELFNYVRSQYPDYYDIITSKCDKVLKDIWKDVVSKRMELDAMKNGDPYSYKTDQYQRVNLEFLHNAKDESKQLFDCVVQLQEIIDKNTAKENSEKTVSVTSKEDPLKILKIRLAKGEISKEEYLEMKKLLE